MIPLWFQSLSGFFHEKLEKQELVDVIFRCKDGCIGGHQVLLGLASTFLSDVLSTNQFVDVESVVIAPDLSVSQVSTFLGALYGGSVPTEDSPDFQSFQEILKLFCLDITTTTTTTTTPTPTPTTLGQTRCSTIVEPVSNVDDDDDEEEVVAEVVEHVVPEPIKIDSQQLPKFFAKNLPTNAQLLQLPSPSVNSLHTATASSSGVQMMQLVQEPSGSYKLVQLSSTDTYQHQQQQQDLVQQELIIKEEYEVVSPKKRSIDVGLSDGGKKKKRKTKKESNSPSQHPQHHLGAPKMMVVCSVCRKTFTKRVFQIYHKAKCSGSVGELICDYCNETGFDTVNILSVHVRVAHIDESKPFLCGYCPARFSTSNGRSCHRALKHGVLNSNKKEWPCEECGKRLTSKVKLLAHIKVVHRGEKGYACSYCPRTFSTKFNQLTHEGLKHTGEKLYRCEQCNLTFDRKTQLRDHLNNYCVLQTGQGETTVVDENDPN